MMDFDSIFNISIGSEDENFDSDQQPNEGSTENSEYAAAQSDSSLYASLESDVDNTEESLNVSCRHIYTRDELVECSISLICLQPPPNWDIAKRRMPEIVLQEPRKKTKVTQPQLEQRPWHMENLAKRNEFAWKNAYMADCTLVVGEDKKEFQCHKYFLCLASPVLEDALKDSEENPKIFLPNISSLNFHKVLEYIYTDKMKKKTLVTIQSAWIAARELGIISLEQYCVTCARQKMCVYNVCSILQFARLINDEEFELSCTQYIQENTAKALHATNWRNIEQRTLQTILELEIVHDTCEVDLFKVCVKWANVNTPLDGNKRDTLGPLISLIRFLAIKVEDFALTVCPTKVLTPEEMVAIFCCLVTGTRDMPAGFSIESSPRNRAVSSDIVQASTSNASSCDSEVQSLVQTEQVELSESSAVGNDKSSLDVLLNQELAPLILSIENSQFELGRESVILLPFGDNKNKLIRDGGQIMQHPLSFSVSSMAYILGFDLISWRKEDESAYYENLQVTLKTQAGTKVVAKFEGSLKRLQRFQVDFDNPVLVFPDTIYKVNVLYSDPSIKHSSYLFTPSKKNFETPWGMQISFKTTLNHYTNIRAICFGEVLQ